MLELSLIAAAGAKAIAAELGKRAGSTAGTRIATALGRDPQQIALKISVQRALERLRVLYPDASESLFDKSFLDGKAAALVARVIPPAEPPTAHDMAVAWRAQFGPGASGIDTFEPIAAEFLRSLRRELRDTDVYRPLFDSETLDAVAAVVLQRDGTGVDVPQELTAPPLSLLGRGDELALVDEWSRTRAVGVIHGMPGVGKTALALEWAHAAAERFPDGQVFRDLHGYDGASAPLSPREILTDWLTSFGGLARDALASSVDALAAQFRQRVAGRHMLFVLDNAADAEQIRPLLPGTFTSFVLVTSRDVPHGLGTQGAARVRLETLAPDAANALLRECSEGRADEDLAAMTTLLGYCEGLPLALRIAGGALVDNPDVSVSELVEQLVTGDLGSPVDPPTHMPSVLEWSYARLPPEAQAAFRRLAVHPGAGADPDAALAGRLLDESVPEAERLLRWLVSRNLVDRSDRRYGMHNLVAEFADAALKRAERASDRRAAVDRLLDAYYGCVNHGFDLLNRNNPMVDAAFLTDWRPQSSALIESMERTGGPIAWFEGERRNILALVRREAAAARPSPMTARLASSLFYFLEVGRSYADWQEMEAIAARLTFGDGYQEGAARDQAKSLRNRGRLEFLPVLEARDELREPTRSVASDASRCLRAIDLLTRAGQRYRAANDLPGEATTLRELADALALMIDTHTDEAERLAATQAAITAYETAESRYRELGNSNAVASLQVGLARVLGAGGFRARAHALLLEALTYAESPSPNGLPRHARLRAYALLRLAELTSQAEQWQTSAEFYRQSIAAFSTLSDTLAVARAYAQLGQIQLRLHEDGRIARESLMRARDGLVDHPAEAQVVNGWIAAIAVE